jgi:hypothetical protein
MTTLALPEPSGNVETPPGRVGWRTPATRAAYPRPVGSKTWAVGFSPIGSTPPEPLTEVLMHGSHAVLGARRTEALRAERAALIASYVDAQVEIFLEMCATADLQPPVTVKVIPDVPPTAQPAQRDSSPHEIYAAGVEVLAQPPREAGGPTREQPNGQANGRGARRGAATGRSRFHAIRRERLRTWPVPHWRCESFPSTGRSLHLFVAPDGRLFEGQDDPWPLTALGEQVQAWPVDTSTIVGAMAEVDARRCAMQVVRGMAHLLWRSGVGL